MSEQTFNLGTKTLEIMLDEGNDSPREWDNLAQMVFFGKHKSYGDKHDFELDGGFDSRQDFMERGAEQVKKYFDAAIVKPVHLYEHSGTAISTSFSYPFNCRWDSGTIGFAIVTKAAIRKEYSVNRVTKELIEKADKILECEVETLNQWISGDIYSFTLETSEGEHIDSCGGFYGSDLKTNGMLDHFDDETKAAVLEQI